MSQVYYAFMCAPKAQLFYLGMTTLLGAYQPLALAVSTPTCVTEAS